jgi:Protein of unknown function (DUF4232)
MIDAAKWAKRLVVLTITGVGAAGLSAQALASSAPSVTPRAAPAVAAPRLWHPLTPSCRTDALALSLGPVDAAGPHDYAVFDLINVSRSTCDLDGYAGIGLRRANDHRVWLRVHDTTGRGYISPAVARSWVHLHPGGEADFWMEWAERGGGKSGSLTVTPPGQSRSIETKNHLVDLDVGEVTVSPVTSTTLNS